MDIELSPSPRANWLAAIAIIGLLGGLILVWLGSSREVEHYGPSALAVAEDGDIFFNAANRIYQADANGTLLESHDYADLGIEGPVMQLSTADGDLLLLDSSHNDLFRCDMSLWRCSPLIDDYDEPPLDILSFALAAEDERLYLATRKGHEIKVYDLEGQHLYKLKVPDGLKYVNDMQWLGRGHLLVTDTNQHRVLELEDLGDGEVTVVMQMDANNDLGKKGRKWPIVAKRGATGGTWVINSSGMLSDGDLIYYDSTGVAQRWVDLHSEDELGSLAIHPLGVLVTESLSQQIIQVDPGDFSVTRFSSQTLDNALSDISQQRRYWQRIYFIGAGIVIVFLSLGMVAAYYDRQARKAIELDSQSATPSYDDGEWDIPDQVKARLSPDAEGVYWLSLKPGHLRNFKVITLILPLLLISLLYLIYEQPSDAGSLPLYLGIAMGILLSVTILWFVHVALPRISLGSDGSRLYLVDFLGRKASQVPQACIKTETRLLIGRVAVPIRRQSLMFYDEALFSALIEPMLEEVTKTNEFALVWRDLRKGDPTAWLSLVALVLVLALQIWFT